MSVETLTYIVTNLGGVTEREAPDLLSNPTKNFWRLGWPIFYYLFFYNETYFLLSFFFLLKLSGEKLPIIKGSKHRDASQQGVYWVQVKKIKSKTYFNNSSALMVFSFRCVVVDLCSWWTMCSVIWWYIRNLMYSFECKSNILGQRGSGFEHRPSWKCQRQRIWI